MMEMMDRQYWSALEPEVQIGHIGTEISDARTWYEKGDFELRRSAVLRAVDLISLTIDDPRQRGRLKHLCRLKEFVADWYLETQQHAVPLEELERYCTEIYAAYLAQQEQAGIPEQPSSLPEVDRIPVSTAP